MLLDDVLENYRKTLPLYPERATSPEEAAVIFGVRFDHFARELVDYRVS